MNIPEQNQTGLERLSLRLTSWIGTPASIIAHTFIFGGALVLPFFGVSMERVLLVLTTLVSLEAIYLAIFIQMTVNRNTQSLAEVEEDIGEIEEDIGEIHEEMEELGDDVEELGEDVEEISENIEEIQEDAEEEEKEDSQTKITLEKIEVDLQRLLADIELLKKQKQ